MAAALIRITVFVNLPAAIFVGAIFLAAPRSTNAQAPPGPLPAAQPQPAPTIAAKPQDQPPEPPPRTTILGAWKLNRDESDDAQKKMQSARGSNRGHGGGYGGGPRMGGSYPGGHRGYGGREAESHEERQKMRELFDPANVIVLSMTGAEVDLTDDQNRKRAFITDGRKLKKSKDESYQEIAAKWDGNRLVTDEKSPQGHKMSRTLELSYDGRQLHETLDMTAGRSDTPIVIRYVYDIAPQSN